MRQERWQLPSPGDVDVSRLSLLLALYGWRDGGGRQGLYRRWLLSEPQLEPAVSLLIPLDPSRADYAELLNEALTRLSLLAPVHPESIEPILDGISASPGDELSFQKETNTPRGAIPWPLGEGLYGAARDALLAAAKAIISKRSYYGNTSGRFAHRYLASVLMGQTAVGSYVVKAFTPVAESFPERETASPTAAIPHISEYTGREITEGLVNALRATQEAVGHFAASGSFSAFDDSVRKGVSHELLNAVKALVQDANEATVRIQWSPVESPRLNDVVESSLSPTVIEFSGSMFPILERAANRLTTLTPTEYVRATGWVKIVERPARGAPGVVRLRVLAGADANIIRVRLGDDQFEEAAGAIARNQGLTVSGRLEKEGNAYWLYDASGIAVLDLPVAPVKRGLTRDRSPGEGQTSTDEELATE